jgi:hypothetical protein
MNGRLIPIYRWLSTRTYGRIYIKDYLLIWLRKRSDEIRLARLDEPPPANHPAPPLFDPGITFGVNMLCRTNTPCYSRAEAFRLRLSKAK